MQTPSYHHTRFPENCQLEFERCQKSDGFLTQRLETLRQYPALRKKLRLRRKDDEWTMFLSHRFPSLDLDLLGYRACAPAGNEDRMPPLAPSDEHQNIVGRPHD